MENVPKIPPPIEMAPGDSTSTHLSYLRRDVDNLSTKIDRLGEAVNLKLDILSGKYVTQDDFQEHLKADADHEIRIRVLEEGRWKDKLIVGSIVGFFSIVGSYIISLLH